MCGAMWDVEQLSRLRFRTYHKYIKDKKSYANKQDFEMKLNLTCQSQLAPKTIGILRWVPTEM